MMICVAEWLFEGGWPGKNPFDCWHLIYDEPIVGGMDVLAILHGARKAESLLSRRRS
jgi:hypothetical protein